MNYYTITVKTNSKEKPPYFMGSMVRGAMGYALKKVTCINPSYKCEGCFAAKECLYYNFYEQTNGFHDYRFNIELGAKAFDFELLLFNEACKSLPYVLSALEMVLTKNGLGRENLIFPQTTISVNGQTIYTNGEFKSFDTPQKSFKIESYSPNIKIKLLTPLRIKKNNQFLRDDVELEDILRSIYQREQELEHGVKVFKLDYTPTTITEMKMLQHKSLVRKSNRQKVRMNMDGIVGEVAVMGVDERSYRLLKLGEVIGVGKQTVMGLGRIEVEDL
jgi:CRISPR-associated endoribonuclease Cas6